MSELRRLFTYLTPHWPRLALAIVGLIGSSVITLALPYAIGLLVDSVFLAQDFVQLNQITAALLILFLIQAVISAGYRYLLQFVGQRTVADLRLSFHRKLLTLPLRFFTNHRVGEIMSRASSDATIIQEAMVNIPASIMRQIATFGGGIILMFSMNWQLSLFVLGVIPPLVLVSSVYGRRLRKLAATAQDKLADSSIVLEEMLSGVRVMKSFTREEHEDERYTAAIEASFQASMDRTRERTIFGPLMGLIGFLAITALIWYGGRQVIMGIITPGELMSFLFYMIVVAAPLAEFSDMWGRLQEASGASQRIFEIMDMAPEPGYRQHRDTQTGLPASTPTVYQNGAAMGEVQFRDVGFRYMTQAEAEQSNNEDAQESPLVLKSIELDVAPGQVVALVGYSGSGKTTLVNLIPRFYDPSMGNISVDGMDISQMSVTELRTQIAVVPQETYLFGGTVRENIAYGRLDATDDEIRAAAEAAYAHQFIDELPNQYETIVGERGVKLSAGQRQRIAIARALLKDPRILILDEATSALDTESERWVQAALERLMQGRTSFVIAHRLSTIQRADMILVLDKGVIVERGAHDVLLAQDGLYRRLHEMQFMETT
ncbi:MAG: ABC transporter ATP-binding protein [Chloroflexota bacterium]